MKSVSCIIPAYNEASRIGVVLAVVMTHSLISEVIVIDDGSTDGTGDQVRVFPKVRLLVNSPNRGKSASVARGMREATGEFILMLDADLVGLTQENISTLVEPVVNGEVSMAMSLRGNSLRTYRFLGMDFFSGERVFAKKLIESVLPDIEKLPGYLLETYINGLIVKNALSIKVVDWKEVIQTRKATKVGFLKGQMKEFQMVYTLLGQVSFIRDVLVQNYKMLKLARG
jgi:glycosyltransferase involved in cell wall biosynthesis